MGNGATTTVSDEDDRTSDGVDRCDHRIDVVPEADARTHRFDRLEDRGGSGRARCDWCPGAARLPPPR